MGVNAPTKVLTNSYAGSARLAAVGNNTATNTRIYYDLPVVTGDTIFVSLYERSDGQTPTSILFVIKTIFGGSETSIPIAVTPAWAPDVNGWMKVTATYTVPSSVDSLRIQPGINTATNFIGTFGVDAVIAVKSSSPVNFADGNSPN